ncbi:class I SAM-dependent methyltransferase [Gordonia hydrophobica]|uniref:Class I SAM-dependent methyltransferase n=1 Tax=Gordonia hydrophobica TaxID=40516 RepID=A0ABZ2U4T9_9ACTN|nr:class I SAM-dependent methyltransferase [Gordonia hydrophobica]MBM7368276.1 SAM-dependent methyltransferase [Gordonia hydrophobica]
MTTQPGYDALADLYDRTFPDPFTTPLERRVVDAFADAVAASDHSALVIDVGCGTGGVAAHLADRGLTVRGVEPSTGMAAIARDKYPHLSVSHGDAALNGLDLGAVRGIVARFSLIHVPPARVREILAEWANRLPIGATLLVAAQSSDEPGVHEFDHTVAKAWRWHPQALAEAVTTAGFQELWRTVSRPDADHRFPEVHLVARR